MRSIEPGISRFPDVQLYIWGLVPTHHPGMTASLLALAIDSAYDTAIFCVRSAPVIANPLYPLAATLLQIWR
jgi:hypothetical protein